MLLNFDDIRPRIGRAGGVRLAPTPTMPDQGPGMGMEPMLQGTNEAMLGPTPGFNPEATQPPAPQGAPAAGGGLFDRIKARLGAVGEKLLPVDPTMAGMLTPEQIAQARQRALMRASASMLEMSGPRPRNQRVSLGQGLGRALMAAQGGFDQDVGGMAGVANSLKQQQALEMQARARAAAKAQIAAQFPVDPAATPEQQQAAVQQQYLALVNAGLGDEPETKSLAMTLQGGAFRPPAGKDLLEVDATDRIELRDPVTGELRQTIKVPPPAATPTTPKAPSPTLINNLQAAFSRQTARFATIGEQLGVMSTSAPTARAGDAPSQMAMIFAYMKLLDPTSAVRETEYANASNAGGIPESVRNQYNNVVRLMKGEMGGSILTPQVVDSFVAQAKRMAESSSKRYKPLEEQFRRRAEKAGIDPDDVVLDPFEGLFETATPPSQNRINGFTKPPQ
jgi:hypothetical protein